MPSPSTVASWSPVSESVEFRAVCPHGVECTWLDIRRDTRLVAVPDCTCP